MADVSHELGSLRFVVDSPLSSKVAMFNKSAQQHQQSQLLNPFSNTSGRVSPKPTFSKEEYGKPLAGSLTEMRGQKANIHVMKDMLELCQIISAEGYQVKDEPNMRVITFGELFNIYNFINDKVVGILLRARKHKLVDFEGEMLFQRRDDDVPIFLLRPVLEIRRELEVKIDDIKRGTSPAPQATSVLMDKSAHMQKLQEAGLVVPGQRSSKSKSRSPSPSPSPSLGASRSSSKASSPAPEVVVPAAVVPSPPVDQTPIPTATTEQVEKPNELQLAQQPPVPLDTAEKSEVAAAACPVSTESAQAALTAEIQSQTEVAAVVESPSAPTQTQAENVATSLAPSQEPSEAVPVVSVAATEAEAAAPAAPAATAKSDNTVEEKKTDQNNNSTNANELPTIVIEASAVYVRNEQDTAESAP